jgi:predicted small secreted protein
MKKHYAFLSLATLISLSSCNTMIGVGRDMRLLGQGMEHKAHGRTWDGDQQQHNEQGEAQGSEQDSLPTY